MRTDTTARPRILLVGDSHGNVRYLSDAVDAARRNGCSRLLQVGDMGIWSGYDGHRFLTDLHRLAQTSGLRIDFIDGNHDNHDTLNELRGISECRADDGSIVVADGVHWWPRGSVTRIGGKTFGFLGGSVSVDRDRRTPGISWWEDEAPTHGDVERLLENTGPGRDGSGLDVLVCHDIPEGIALPAWDGWPRDALEDAAEVRRLLTRAVTNVRPVLYVHGHWHVRHRTTRHFAGRSVDIVGLGCESPDGFAVYDTADGGIDDLGIRFPAAEDLAG